jgi:hypothetical protein
VNWTQILISLKSIKTTIAGVIAGLLIILPQLQNLLDADPATLCSWEAIATGLAVMGIGILARDGNLTSKDVGAVTK